MEKFVKTMFKIFEIEFPLGNFGIITDAEKRMRKFNQLDLEEKIQKIGVQLWSRPELITMFIDRLKYDGVKNKN